VKRGYSTPRESKTPEPDSPHEFGISYGTRGKNPYKSSFMENEPTERDFEKYKEKE